MCVVRLNEQDFPAQLYFFRYYDNIVTLLR